MTYLAVAIGGAAGALARFALSNALAALLGTAFPWATLFINVSGALVLGCFYTLSLHAATDPAVKALVAPGFLGAYTTFSTLSVETLAMARDGDLRGAALYVAASVALGLLAAWAGSLLGQALLRPRG